MKLILTILTLTLSLNLFAQEAAFDGETTLTLDEEQNSELYIHEGIASNTSNDLCANGGGKYKDICTNQTSAFSGGLGSTLEALLPAVTKAYALIIGATNPKLSKKQADGTTESKTDYCQYIAVAGEALSVVTSQLQNSKTQENFIASKPEARQAASFYAIATTHKDQAKASSLQAGIWGSTAACYGALLAAGVVSGDVQLYAKAAGAAVIAAFYLKKASVHKQRSKLLTEFAEKLPQAGECNPYTQPSCFCNEESSFAADPANFQKFCVPKDLIARNGSNDATVCIGSNQQVDIACSCATNNTCIDTVLQTGALSFGLSPTSIGSQLAGLQPFSTGLGTAALDPVTGTNLTNVNRLLKDSAPSGIGSLSDSEKEIASSIANLGLPNAAAAIIAKSGATADLPPSLSGAVSGGELVAAVSKSRPIVRGSSSGGYESGKSSSKKKRRSSNRSASAKKRGSRSSKTGAAIQISDDYALKAQRDAEIVKDTEANLFDVISSRYQTSAWRQFPEAIQK